MSRIKESYKIPMSINVNRWHTPISLKKGSVGFKKPITLAVIISAMGTFVLWMIIVYQMLVSHFGLLAPLVFTIGYIMLAVLALRRNKTRERGYKWFVPTYRYWFRSDQRFIGTRGSSDEREVTKLKNFIPIEFVDEDTGLIEYTNGDVGAVFEIIGNGSRALFIEEKEKIITAFEGVLQQLDLDVSVTVESKQSKQDCSEQIRNLEYLRNKTTEPEVDRMLGSRIDILKDEIQTSFKSTHQYLFIRAHDEERLNTTINLFLKQRSEGLFRYMEPITGEKLMSRLSEFFKLA